MIPEKASSFSIHPDRLCQDQCFYCGGKFGLFDTPLHIAQIKTQERQKKILDSKRDDFDYISCESRNSFPIFFPFQTRRNSLRTVVCAMPATDTWTVVRTVPRTRSDCRHLRPLPSREWPKRRWRWMSRRVRQVPREVVVVQMGRRNEIVVCRAHCVAPRWPRTEVSL